MENKNIFVNFRDGTAALIHTNTATVEDVETFLNEKALEFVEAYEIKDEDIQYYLFDERLFAEKCKINILKGV